MPSFVILGSCKHEPYEILAMPNILDKELYANDHEKAYDEACKVFYPAMDIADVVLVWAPDGVGEHTQKDIDYAVKQGKKVVYLQDEVTIDNIKVI